MIPSTRNLRQTALPVKPFESKRNCQKQRIRPVNQNEREVLTTARQCKHSVILHGSDFNSTIMKHIFCVCSKQNDSNPYFSKWFRVFLSRPFWTFSPLLREILTLPRYLWSFHSSDSIPIVSRRRLPVAFTSSSHGHWSIPGLFSSRMAPFTQAVRQKHRTVESRRHKRWCFSYQVTVLKYLRQSLVSLGV